MWFGTQGGGVSRLSLDGKSFVHLTEKEGLCSDFVSSILEDKSGNIWIGTRFGVSMLTKSKLSEISGESTVSGMKAQDVLFKNYSYEDGFLGIGCTSLCEDNNGTIWMGSNDRLTAYHPPVEGEMEDTLVPNIQLTGIALFNENISWQMLEKSKDTSLILGNGVKISDYHFDSITRWGSLPENLSLAYNNNYQSSNKNSLGIFSCDNHSSDNYSKQNKNPIYVSAVFYKCRYWKQCCK